MAAVAVGQNQGTSYVFQLPGTGNGASNIIGYVSPATAVGHDQCDWPEGLTKSFLSLTGASSTSLQPRRQSRTPAIQIADPTFTTSTPLRLGSAPTLLAITPDGSHAIVAAGNVYVIDTGTDQIGRQPLAAFGNRRGSHLQPGFHHRLRTRKQQQRQPGHRFRRPHAKADRNSPGNIGRRDVHLHVALGLIYATAVNRIYEIDPSTMRPRRTV